MPWLPVTLTRCSLSELLVLLDQPSELGITGGLFLRQLVGELLLTLRASAGCSVDQLRSRGLLRRSSALPLGLAARVRFLRAHAGAMRLSTFAACDALAFACAWTRLRAAICSCLRWISACFASLAAALRASFLACCTSAQHGRRSSRPLLPSRSAFFCRLGCVLSMTRGVDGSGCDRGGCGGAPSASALRIGAERGARHWVRRPTALWQLPSDATRCVAAAAGALLLHAVSGVENAGGGGAMRCPASAAGTARRVREDSASRQASCGG